MSQFLTPSANVSHVLDSDYVQDIDSGDEIVLDEAAVTEDDIISQTTAPNNLNNTFTQYERPSSGQSQSSDEEKKGLPPLVVENYYSADALLNGIFEVEGKSFDVSLHRSHITLKAIGGSRKNSIKKRPKSVAVDNDTIEIMLKDVFAVTTSKLKNASGKKSEKGMGVELHTYSEKEGNRVKYRTLFMAHPSEKLSSTWTEKINALLKGVLHRPRTCKIFRSIKGCTKAAKQQFEDTVLPMIQLSNMTVSVTGVMNDESIARDIEAADLSSYDCLIVAGGDDTVHTVINALIKKVQFDNGVVLGGKESLLQVLTPIGVIPCGMFNTIAHTVHGTSDMVTATLHIICGRQLVTDVMSITSPQASDMFEFAMYAHYGFGGNLLSVMEGKSAAQHKQVAIMKTLTANKLRAYDCDVKYIMAPASCGDPATENPCRSGCLVCNINTATPHIDGSHYSDSLCEFNPLEASSSSSQLKDLREVRNEQTVKGEFMSVSLVSVPCMDDLAPLGLSKYTHLADGCIDMVLVNNVKRKEFMKVLQRVGNTKNQLAYDYVQAHRVREVTFHARFPIGWNYRDDTYSEIDDQAKTHSRSVKKDDVRTLDDGPGGGTFVTVMSLHDEDDDDSDSNEGYDTPRRSSTASSVWASGSNSGDDGASHLSQEFAGLTTTLADDSHAGHVHPIHKYTMADRLRKKRAEKEMAKEKKQKTKHEKQIKSVWNIDSVIMPHTDLTFKVHQKLLTFYGSHLDQETETSDVFCFPAI